MSDAPQDDSGGGASERIARAAAAARELCDALWDALQQELPDPARAQALAVRLGEVSSTVALLLEGTTVATAADALSASSEHCVPAVDEVSHPRMDDSRPDGERRTPPRPIPPPSAPVSQPGTRLVDEQTPATVTQLPGWREERAADPDEAAEIEVRDVRREEGAAAWISSVGRMLARHSEDHLPFAVLLVEIVDVAHLERSETPHDLHDLVAQVERALGRGMRASDELSRETLGRYWLLAPETNGTGARMLAERLARLVRDSATHREVPMEVAIGIAVCPEDGTEAPMLAARADLGVYSARATGRPVVRTDPPG